jgi:hypothetical protein
MYNLLVGEFSGKITDSITKSVSDSISKGVTSLNREFLEFPVRRLRLPLPTCVTIILASVMFASPGCTLYFVHGARRGGVKHG